MRKYVVCVYAICKNEEAFVDRWMNSMSEADMVVVLDTGSTDRTVERLEERGATVYSEKITPWRFDRARNLSLSHVPDNVDIAVCTDLDEVFHPGWRQLLEDAWTSDATMANYLYNWKLNADGTPNTQFVYFKAHARDCYEWSCPVHEFLKFTPKKGRMTEKRVFVEGMVLDHHPDDAKSRSSYLPLLEMGVAEAPNDDRMAYYLGREYMFTRRWRDCIQALERHLNLPRATWREERCASMRWIARSHYELGENDDAYAWYYKAIAEMPRMREPYVECAKMAYSLDDWVTVIHMTNEALKIVKKSDTYINMGYSWDFTPNDLAAIAYYRLGNYEESLTHAKQALTYAKDDPRLVKNYHIIRAKAK